MNSSSSKDELFSLFGEASGAARAAYDPDGNNDFAGVLTKFNTDWVWAEPGRFAARAFVAQGEPAYVYHFDYVPAPINGRMRYSAGQRSEVGSVFWTITARSGFPADPKDTEMAKRRNTYWANFAETGDPNGDGLLKWPVYCIQNEEIRDIQSDGKTVGSPDLRKVRLDVIEKAVEKRVRIQSRGGI